MGLVTVSGNPAGFRDWLRNNQQVLRQRNGRGGFGNHRKYVSIDADWSNGTGAAVQGYVNLVGGAGGHTAWLASAGDDGRNTPELRYNYLYGQMRLIPSFGRTGSFDHVCMLGKLGFAQVRPGSAYLLGSTGPTAGARLLFQNANGPQIAVLQLDQWTQQLGDALNLGMQEMEDSLCNWQKSADVFRAFRG